MSRNYSIDDGSVAIACQNNAVPAESQPQYLARGLWVVDFDSEYSFHTDDASSASNPSEVSSVFNRFEEASQAGGIGTLRADNTELIAVGQFATEGIRLLNKVGNSDKKKKGLQFEEYAVLGPGDSEYGEAKQLADTLGGTVVSLKDRGKKVNRLEELLERVERKGYLRKPVR